MLMTDYQSWLNAKGANLSVDGQGGPATRDATKAAFVNLKAPAVTDDQIAELAYVLGCSVYQLMAVANVESSGAGFDQNGRPKILFERHKFYDFTDGAYGISDWSNPNAGGYDQDSWEKLTGALCQDIDAAFKSASWGKFQVMGFNAYGEGYTSALDAAFSTTISEANHYRLFAYYIQMAGLQDELRQVSVDPDDCRPFAKGYNGSGYESGNYHVKIADQMSELYASGPEPQPIPPPSPAPSPSPSPSPTPTPSPAPSPPPPSPDREMIEAVIAAINARFPHWMPTATMLGYARACMRLYGTVLLPASAIVQIEATIGRLEMGAKNTAAEEDDREWCASLAGDLRQALGANASRPDALWLTEEAPQ